MHFASPTNQVPDPGFNCPDENNSHLINNPQNLTDVENLHPPEPKKATDSAHTENVTTSTTTSRRSSDSVQRSQQLACLGIGSCAVISMLLGFVQILGLLYFSMSVYSNSDKLDSAKIAYICGYFVSFLLWVAVSLLFMRKRSVVRVKQTGNNINNNIIKVEAYDKPALSHFKQCISAWLKSAFIGIYVAVFLEKTLTFRGDQQDEVKAGYLVLAYDMLVVGFSEETVKFFSFIVGLHFLSRSYSQSSQCSTCWAVNFYRLLAESPVDLVLLGLAAGYGLMTMENVLYFISFYHREPEPSFFALFFRCFLNIHPLLTGIAAAKYAKRVFMPTLHNVVVNSEVLSQPRALQVVRWVPRGLTPKQKAWAFLEALWLPILLHAFFDFVIYFGISESAQKSSSSLAISAVVSVIVMGTPFLCMCLLAYYVNKALEVKV